MRLDIFGHCLRLAGTTIAIFVLAASPLTGCSAIIAYRAEQHSGEFIDLAQRGASRNEIMAKSGAPAQTETAADGKLVDTYILPSWKRKDTSAYYDKSSGPDLTDPVSLTIFVEIVTVGMASPLTIAGTEYALKHDPCKLKITYDAEQRIEHTEWILPENQDLVCDRRAGSW